MRKLFFIMIATLLCAVGAVAQTKTIHGTVLDAVNNEPLVGASVLPIGGGQGVATDIDGKFAITVPAKVKTAKITYVGYTPQVAELKDNMTIYLASEAANLDDVVVVAYGTQKKSSITGAISTVDAEEIAKRPVSSATAALEGVSPGITVTGNYGSPGESPTILIRGIGTVNGSTAPLYVIDGVPFGGNISDINPDDIESMSVLKDAASAALYGNRASNGVILITTKRNKDQKINFNLRVNQGWYERAIPEYDRTDARQFMKVSYENYKNSILQDSKINIDKTDINQVHNYVVNNIFGSLLYANYFNKRTGADLYGIDGNLVADAALLPEVAEDVNWFDQATRNGYRQEYVLSGSGASSKSDYYFSTSYLGEEGYMKDSDFDRFTARLSVNITPAKWLRTGLMANMSHQIYHNTSNGVGDGSGSYNNPFMFCRYIAPIYPAHQHYVTSTTYYDESGNPYTVNAGQYLLDENGQHIWDNGYYTVYNSNGSASNVNTRNQYQDRHVIMESELNKSVTKRNTMNATGYVDILLPYGFTLSAKGNLNTRNSDSFNYGSAEIGDSKARGGSLSKTIYNYKNWNFQQQLNWNKQYGVHNVQVLLGHENFCNNYDYTYTVKDKEAFKEVYALSNFSVMNSIEGYRSEYKTESYLGRVMYNYNDRYNFEASIRRDGTSRFYKDSRWGTFGSVGANWVFSNESFMKDLKWLNNGKLRADWGRVGNDAAAGYYSYYALYGSDTNASLPAYFITQSDALGLQWESSESWGLALDTRLFNRLNLTVEYFDKRNKDLIFSVLSAPSAGSTSTGSQYYSKQENIGTISNRGIEISADVDIYKDRNWKINVGANMTYIKNKVTKLPDQNKVITRLAADPSMQPPAGILSGSQFIAEGSSRYQWYTYHWAGVDMMTGNSMYDADLVNYHVKTADGTIIGGSYEVDKKGNPVYDAQGNMVRISTAIPAASLTEINGKYYVNNTTYAGKKWCGDALPSTYGSFQGNVSFKDFTLQAMFTYSLGGKIMDGVYSSLMSCGQTPSNYHVDILNCWQEVPAGMTADSPDRLNPNINPVLNYNNNTYNNATSDRWLVSRNYLCFKNINLTYSLPRKLSRPLGLSRVQFSFSAENLHIWGSRKGMNPMMSISGGQSNYLVPARVFTFGLNVNI